MTTTKTRVATALSRAKRPTTAADEILRSLGEGLEGASPVLLVVFASPVVPLAELLPLLTARFPKAVVIGATSAGEFTQERDAKGSTSVFAVAGDVKVTAAMGCGLRADTERAVQDATKDLGAPDESHPHAMTLLLFDPLAGSGETVTLLVAAALGDGAPIAGGAAGDDLKMVETMVGLGKAVATDALVVARVYTRAPLGLGVAHGHQPLSPPLRVTKAEGAVVHEIEGRPAWDVWRAETRAAGHAVGIDVDALAPEAEGAFFLRFEAGLASGDGFYKIRAPLARKGTAIHFATEMPEGSVIRITQSVPEDQVASAKVAARRARAALGGGPVAGALVFDCICRNLILGTDFVRAVHGMQDELGGAPLAGFETYGEVALDETETSGFHNTTSVVVAFPET
jgi:methyl-accepting chemotaxis protein